MTEQKRVVLTVTSEGLVSAETQGLIGDACLDYIAILEDLLDARTVESAYTADYSKRTVTSNQEERNVEHA
ncbi:DUF2997 domain-containing protein [Micromonospora terminaliae]|uniref:DUF2997 domain-containing protein n=1 Tax=Micromonospora terminaliae TaxID=1914461 RepID=A0AAJ2ZL19_9ACTN|nr:DUF2997 domain-containing protein [Micromonospora terminaliae]NES30794.1 DUF2997 domain-containing protein [Micromonospora terminaliae]QGL51082.1 DUF2997 domain-containing protein [Micromonospora terminaliae]